MEKDFLKIGRLSVDPGFHDFIHNELLPRIDVQSDKFWAGVEHIVTSLTAENRYLLGKRDEIQAKIDEYHRSHTDSLPEQADYVSFLDSIGYLVEPGPPFQIETTKVDPEIASIAGPQLVVPVSNARFALNAANARWGSLYDALYGTDVIDRSGDLAPGDTYNPKRGEAVIARAAAFLDTAVPLTDGSHADVAEYRVDSDADVAVLSISMQDGSQTSLEHAEKFLGFAESGSRRSLLLRNNGLHIEIQIDAEHPIGRDAGGNVSDIVLESAVTTIQDCEDSVAAVDAADKTNVYRNWFGLMQGTLEVEMTKGGKIFTRRLNRDHEFTSVGGGTIKLPGRSLMLVRNVGHLMQTNAILDGDGDEVFEGILDAIMTVACALNDIRGESPLPNSRTGSIYIVKPKMHGPREVEFTDRLMSMVEDLYGLDRYTIKIGVMDEERRTTVNLQECIRAVKNRLVFINTGFLDRTGDEIHTSMHAGPFLRKDIIKQQPWILAYEDWNVDVGIRCGLPGRAQIGKGMFPKTDEMKEMVDTKLGHLEAGASCAWVPSPTAASLHAMHYHYIDVAARQRELASREIASLDDILTIPLGDPSALSADEIQAELDNNAQGILGYVVRWIDQGVGCSKVPDISSVDLMEDRATLRISSQHIANWLLHGVCDESQVRETMLRMATIVDEQNASDPTYTPMAADPENSIAFKAACGLVFEGTTQPSGYTEPLLHGYRRELKRISRGAGS
jgi:malate synthase